MTPKTLNRPKKPNRASTYVVCLALLLSVLAAPGFGTNQTDAAAVVSCIAERPGEPVAWNITIYVGNSLALLLLLVALLGRTGKELPDASPLTSAVGLIWAAAPT
jgi:hypothetical protein